MNTPITKAPLTPSGSAAQTVLAPPPFKLGGKLDNTPFLKLLAYSRPGWGKTELLGSAADVPQMLDVLYVDCESGDTTIRDNPRIKNWEHLIANHVRVTSFKEVAQIHDWLKGHCAVRDKEGEQAEKVLREQEARLRGCEPSDIDRPMRFRTVIVDSLSEVNAMSNAELLGVSEAKVLAGNADEIEVSTWDEFRKNNQRIQMLVRAFRDLPMNILFAAGEQYKQDELKKFHYEPNVTGQLARQVQAFFDIVGYGSTYIQGDKKERRLYVQPIDKFDAKNRRSVFKADFFKDTEVNMTGIMKGTGLLKQTPAA
jgi:hypothetical protein